MAHGVRGLSIFYGDVEDSADALIGLSPVLLQEGEGALAQVVRGLSICDRGNEVSADAHFAAVQHTAGQARARGGASFVVRLPAGAARGPPHEAAPSQPS